MKPGDRVEVLDPGLAKLREVMRSFGQEPAPNHHGWMKPLKVCANGCARPPDPPSKVICRPCQDAIAARLEEILDEAERKAAIRLSEAEAAREAKGRG